MNLCKVCISTSLLHDFMYPWHGIWLPLIGMLTSLEFHTILIRLSFLGSTNVGKTYSDPPSFFLSTPSSTISPVSSLKVVSVGMVYDRYYLDPFVHHTCVWSPFWSSMFFFWGFHLQPFPPSPSWRHFPTGMVKWKASFEWVVRPVVYSIWSSCVGDNPIANQKGAVIGQTISRLAWSTLVRYVWWDATSNAVTLLLALSRTSVVWNIIEPQALQ